MRDLAVVGPHVAEGRLVARHQVGDVRILRFLQLSQVCCVVRLRCLLQAAQLRLIFSLDGARLPLKLLPQPAELLGIVQPADGRSGQDRRYQAGGKEG